jgi:glycosyltransferase involved in cell wall biosynthesis
LPLFLEEAAIFFIYLLMKKIIFTVTTDLNFDQRMIRICSSLANAGYDVLLVGRLLKNSKPIDNQSFMQKRLFCFFQKGKLFYAEYNLRLFFYLLLQKFDTICAIDLDTILPCFLVGKMKNKVVVYDAHEYFTEVPEVVERAFTKRIWEAIADFCIPRIKYCYTVGEGLAAIFSKRYAVDFQVIRNISIAKNANFVVGKKEKKIILYQGALNVGRGLEQYIEAMQWIENAELHLAGDGDIRLVLEQLVRDFKVENKVVFLGKLKPNELTQTTQKAFLGLNLLENKGLSYYYSLANKTFDYIQAEIPALHPDFPEYQAIMKQYEVGVLLDLDAQKIANCISNLLSDEKKYAYLQAECKRAKAIFTWENEEQKLIDFYRNM